MGTFKRPIVGPSQKGSHVDFNRAGQYSSRALQEVLRGLTGGANGFTSATALLVSAAGAGNFNVSVAPGIGFQYDATGLGADESPYRVIELYAAQEVSMGGAPPAAGTYYVYVRWGSADGQSEVRESRAAPGAPFVPGAINTAHVSAPTFVVAPAPGVAGHILLAKVVVPDGAVDSTAYTITDVRRMVWPPRYLYEHLGPAIVIPGGGILEAAGGKLTAVADGAAEYIVPESSDRRLMTVSIWAKVTGGAATCQATLSRVTYATGAVAVVDTAAMPVWPGYSETVLAPPIALPLVEDGHYVVDLAFVAGGGSLVVNGAVARYQRLMYNVP